MRRSSSAVLPRGGSASAISRAGVDVVTAMTPVEITKLDSNATDRCNSDAILVLRADGAGNFNECMPKP